jgi:hypothetical protein
MMPSLVTEFPCLQIDRGPAPHSSLCEALALWKRMAAKWATARILSELRPVGRPSLYTCGRTIPITVDIVATLKSATQCARETLDYCEGSVATDVEGPASADAATAIRRA